MSGNPEAWSPFTEMVPFVGIWEFYCFHGPFIDLRFFRTGGIRLVGGLVIPFTYLPPPWEGAVLFGFEDFRVTGFGKGWKNSMLEPITWFDLGGLELVLNFPCGLAHPGIASLGRPQSFRFFFLPASPPECFLLRC